MRGQLALLLAVALIGLGHGSPQWSRQSWHRMGGQTTGGTGYGWNRNAVQWTQSAPEWMNRQMGGHSMSGPRYTDYSWAGQNKYGGAQNYGVGDYGLHNGGALAKESKKESKSESKKESKSLFFETTATRPVFSDVPLDEQCEKKPGPTPNKGIPAADVKCEHKCMDGKCYVTAHVSCNCRSPFMDDPADQQEECLRGTVTGLHNATNIPRTCDILPDGACNNNDCENGIKEPKSKDPLWKECRDEIDAWDDDDGLAKPEVEYYCAFSCQEHSGRCWAKTRTTCKRESYQRAKSGRSTRRSNGWFTITEEEWRGPAFMEDGETPNGDPKFPPECRGVARKRCAKVFTTTDGDYVVHDEDDGNDDGMEPVKSEGADYRIKQEQSGIAGKRCAKGFTTIDGDYVTHDEADGAYDGMEPLKSEGALYGPGAPQVQTGTGGKQGKDYWLPKDVNLDDFRRYRNRRRF